MSEAPVRRLGFVESFFAELHEKAAGSSQVVSAAELRGTVDPLAARRALGALYDGHPLLRVGLAREGDGWWYFVPAGPFDDVPVNVRSYEEPDGWRRLLERELDDPVPNSGPLWRATLLVGPNRRASVLLLTLHHAITDGLSMLALNRQFVEAHNRAARGLVPGVGRFPLREPVERLLASTSRKEAVDPQPPLPEDARWPFEASVPPDRRRSRVLWRVLDPPDTRALLGRCTAERTTVNAALVGTLVAAAQRLPTCGATVACMVLTDVRQRACPQVSPEEIGPYFRDVILAFEDDVLNLDPWERARLVRQRYRKRRPQALVAPPNFSASDIGAAVSAGLDPSRPAFGQGFVVTNMGRHFAGSDDGPLRLASVQGTVSPRSGGLATLVSVTALDDRMVFAFTSADPLLSEDSAEGFADEFMASLQKALRS